MSHFVGGGRASSGMPVSNASTLHPSTSVTAPWLSTLLAKTLGTVEVLRDGRWRSTLVPDVLVDHRSVERKTVLPRLLTAPTRLVSRGGGMIPEHDLERLS